MDDFSWSVLIGGFAFFFFGLRSARRGLEVVAGDRLRAAMGKLAGNRLSAFSFGAFVTLILQSSGATSAMLVSFCETGLLTLAQATAVLLGADIGTTFVVVLLSVKKITEYALLVVAVGFFMEIWCAKRRTRDIGSIVLGFGLIFYGMHMMTVSAEPLKHSEMAMKAFAFLAGHPFATLVLASVVSGAIHSAGTIGIAIALAFAGAITLEAALPIVLGANIGSCVTAVLAGIGSGTEGRRVALAHTLSKVIGVLIVFPFIPKVAVWIGEIDRLVAAFWPGYDTGVAAKIAISHILFNVGLAVVFLPLLGPLVALVKIILPSPPPTEKKFGPKYLDKSSLDTPSLAFAQAKREIMRIGMIAQRLFSECLRMFSRGEDYLEETGRIEDEDDKIDTLEKAVRFYLAEVSMERMSQAQVRTQMALLGIASDLEEIGDIVSREMTHLAIKKAKWHRIFSDEGWRDLRHFQAMVMENFNLMLSLLTSPSEDIAVKIERHELHMEEVEQHLRQAHITRLHQGLQESFDTSSIHLDILANIRRINAKITHIAELAIEA
ncbi:MAG TPA: Na/Pi cotransporter family protein [bacterium]|nr:Na/Pi cotransporter family protein [bacterium]